MDAQIAQWAAAAERRQHVEPVHRSLDPLAAEIIAARLMRSLGIGAPTEIVELASDDTPDESWIVKTFRGERMKHGDSVNGSRRIAVKRIRIPGTISLAALRRYHNVYAEQRRWNIPVPNLAATVLSGLRYAFTGQMPDGNVTSDILVENVAEFLAKGRDPQPREFFADFVLPEDCSAILAAIDPTSQPMLEIHAARAFLACTTAHAGNILVDADAKLYSIDHELCVASNPKEIELLRMRVRAGTRAHLAMLRIADTLTEARLIELFYDLPEVNWPMGDRATTVGYFIRRLDHWRHACD